METTSKICTKCKINKSTTEFKKDRTKIDGLYSSCKKCVSFDRKISERKLENLPTRIYHHQVETSKKREHKLPAYTREQLKEWLLSQDKYHTIHSQWADSGYKKELTPSVDRLDDYKGYRFDNIQITTWEDNNLKGRSDIYSGKNTKYSKAVLQLDCFGEIIKEYKSIAIAARENNLHLTAISAVCRGVESNYTAGGFVWKFKDE